MNKEPNNDKLDYTHNHENEHNECEEHDTITLTFEDNKTVTCNVLDIFENNSQEYIALIPQDGQDVYLYKYQEFDNDEIELSNIEDDNEFDMASKKFETLLESYENDNEE